MLKTLQNNMTQVQNISYTQTKKNNFVYSHEQIKVNKPQKGISLLYLWFFSLTFKKRKAEILKVDTETQIANKVKRRKKNGNPEKRT